MADKPEDLSDELKRKIAESVRGEIGAIEAEADGAYVVQAGPRPGPFLGAMPGAGPVPVRPYSVNVDLLESGMILRYSHPVKRKYKVPARSGFNIANEPGVQLFFEGLMEALDGGEDWNEGTRGGKVGKIIQKLQAMSAPKTVERYVLESRSIACKDEGDLAKGIETAREAARLVKELQDSGELGGHHMHGCFGSPADGIGDVIGGVPDYTLGA